MLQQFTPPKGMLIPHQRKMINKDYPSDMVEWMGKTMVMFRDASKYFALKYGIRKQKLNKWKKACMQRKLPQGRRGRPNVFDENAIEELRSFQYDETYLRSQGESDTKLTTIAHSVRKRRGYRVNPNFQLSLRTKNRLLDRLDLTVKGSEATTNAREHESFDIRNFISFLVAMLVVVQVIYNGFIINVDGSTFTVGGTGSKRQKCIAPKARKKNLKTRQTPESKDGLLYTIKFYLIICALGFQGPPVFIIASEFGWCKLLQHV